MPYTLGQAAKATGLTKPTISKAIANGRISAVKQDNGSYSIDPAELHRVFPPLSLASKETPASLPLETPSSVNADNGLRALVETLQEQLADLREDRNHWREMAERTTRLLEAPASDAKPRRSWWPFGKANDA